MYIALDHKPDLAVYVAFYYALRILSLYPLTFTDETEDDEVNKEYVEDTNRDAVMIAAA